MNPIAIIMLIFAAILMVVALIVYSGDTGLIRTINFIKVKDKRDYARFLGKSLGLCAVIIALSGCLALVARAIYAVLLMVVSLIGALIMISKKSHKYYK